MFFYKVISGFLIPLHRGAFKFSRNNMKCVFILLFINSHQTDISNRNSRWCWSDDAERHHRDPSVQLQVAWSGEQRHIGDLEFSVESARQSVLQSAVRGKFPSFVSALGRFPTVPGCFPAIVLSVWHMKKGFICSSGYMLFVMVQFQ